LLPERVGRDAKTGRESAGNTEFRNFNDVRAFAMPDQEDSMPNEADAHTEHPSLEGKKAIITGGTTGIGRAIAVLLASHGVDVFICGRDPQHLEDALQRIGQVGRGDGIATDLAEAGNVKRFFNAGVAYLGGLDFAVINAAIPAKGVTAMSEADLRYAIAIDFTAYLLSAHAAAEALEDHGNIVFVGSMSAHMLGAESSVYAGMKLGIQGFTEALRKELAPKGIQVGVIEPGKTGADFQYPQFSAEEQAEAIRKDEMLRAEDIAVGVQYMLTQPRRAVVQQLTIAPRMQPKE
jgi:NADP-dependent 3-hydroxy acid dehydrogenase YdfG